MLMDLMEKYFSDSYGVVTSLTYDVEKRILTLECSDKLGSNRVSRRITVTNILEYSEDVEHDPESSELIIGFDRDGDQYCIRTESREIRMKTNCIPDLEFLK